jgi:hypothetical protein
VQGDFLLYDTILKIPAVQAQTSAWVLSDF